jgi:hypothetical protein
MIQRCQSVTDQNYHYYGGRGITVCESWQKFENFAADMGQPPEGLTLDREDNNKGYNPENCRWSSRKEQANNKRGNIYVNYAGKNMTLGEASTESGIAYPEIYRCVVVRKQDPATLGEKFRTATKE